MISGKVQEILSMRKISSFANPVVSTTFVSVSSLFPQPAGNKKIRKFYQILKITGKKRNRNLIQGRKKLQKKAALLLLSTRSVSFREP